MAKRKYQFKPDRNGVNVLNKLYIPQSERLQILKWTLYSLLFLALLVIQDSMLSRYRIFGGVIDLTPAFVILVAVFEGSNSGSVFALVTSMIYVFAGTGPSNYGILLLTVCACVAAVFREEFLRRSFDSLWMCSAAALLLYEMGVFVVGAALGVTHWERVLVFLLTSVYSILMMPVLYPLIRCIGKIGGETWKE